MIKRYLAVLLMLFMALPVCACAGRPSQKRMEYVVETEVPESASCVSTKEVDNDICFVSTQSNWVSDSRMITVKYRKRKKKAANWPSSSLCIGHTCFLTALSVCDLINIE